MLNKCLHARIQLYSESRPAYIEVFYKKTTPPPSKWTQLNNCPSLFQQTQYEIITTTPSHF